MIPLLRLKNICKSYLVGEIEIRAVCDVNIDIDEGEFIAIMGHSGSGKSTLMQMSGLLDRPTSGEIYLRGKRVDEFSEKELARLRNKEIGFIFQQFNLLPKIPAWENVALPLVYAGVGARERFERAKAMLELVGLHDRINNARGQLSGGQQQRVAIARALVNQPSIVFADEPTGNLDTKSGKQIMEFLKKLNKEGKTIVLVTHESMIAKYAKRRIRLRDGEIIEDSKKRVLRKQP